MNVKSEFPIVQILDENGNCNEKLMPKLSDGEIREIYEWMVFVRRADEITWNLQREGRILTYAPIRGQEASQVASAYAMSKGDWLFPMYRSLACMAVHGVPLEMLLQYTSGDERGSKFPDGVNVFPIALPVASQIPHAVGFGWGLEMQKKNAATVVYFGEGATSKADFHEGMNFAGVFKIPVVAICENNQWAISVPTKGQTASETFAQKAIAYGIEGVRVDGNDVFAVYKATKEALDRAKSGKGPTLIECVTYRIGHHTTADDSAKYRDLKEVEEWKKKDHIDRLRKYMQKKGTWSENDEKKLLQEVERKVNATVKSFEAIQPPQPKDMFNYVYAELTPELKEQMTESGYE